MPLKIVWSFDYADERDTGIPTALLGFNSNSTVVGGPPLPPWGSSPAYGLALAGYPGATPNTYLVNPYSQHNNNYRFNYGGVPTNADNPDAQFNNPFDENIAQGFTQNLDADIGSVHLKSISAYRWSNSGNSETLAGMPINYYAFVSQYYQHQASQELQFSGKSGNFDWIGGTYCFQEGGSERSDSQAFGFLTPVFNAFGSADRPATRQPQLRGLRWALDRGVSGRPITISPIPFGPRWDTATPGMSATSTNQGRNDIYGANLCSVGVTAGTPLAAYPNACSDYHQAYFSYPAWTASLDWEVMPNTFVYIKTDKASMAGGFNTRPVPPSMSQSL